MPGVKVGDVWDALTVAPSGAALGTSYFDTPFSFHIPTRGFGDGLPVSASLQANLHAHGINPVASGKYGQNRTGNGTKMAATFNTMADWSNPGTTVITGVDTVAFYLGGWTPHVWTQTQINAQSVYWMMPIWVYNPNTPGATQGNADGKAAVSAMKSVGVATGARIAVDMESSIDEPYLAAFRNVIGPAGYHLMVYGGPSTVFQNWPQNQNGPGGGWWVADWTFQPHLYNHAGVWATQWTNPQNPPPWDQSVTADLTELWWHKPVTFTFKAVAKDATTGLKASKSSSFVVASA